MIGTEGPIWVCGICPSSSKTCRNCLYYSCDFRNTGRTPKMCVWDLEFRLSRGLSAVTSGGGKSGTWNDAFFVTCTQGCICVESCRGCVNRGLRGFLEASPPGNKAGKQGSHASLPPKCISGIHCVELLVLCEPARKCCVNNRGWSLGEGWGISSLFPFPVISCSKHRNHSQCFNSCKIVLLWCRLSVRSSQL